MCVGKPLAQRFCHVHTKYRYGVLYSVREDVLVLGSSVASRMGQSRPGSNHTYSVLRTYFALGNAPRLRREIYILQVSLGDWLETPPGCGPIMFSVPEHPPYSPSTNPASTIGPIA